VRVARREGLPDPVPATIRPRGAPAAQESQWQELVVRHLGVGDWLRPEFDDELDLVGPVAAEALRRHGLLWPFNAHFHVPLLEAARGGSLLTGIGGDELFRSAESPRAAGVLMRRVRPAPADARRVAGYLAPAAARRLWHGRRRPEGLHPWLTSAGDAAGRRALAAWEAAEPRRLRARMSHVRAARYLRIGTASLDLLARDSGAEIHHPLLEPAVWAAVARSAPAGGHLNRRRAMTAAVGGLLPGELLARRDKASFDEVFFHDHSRRFAEAWDGSGVPAGLVDPGALRAHWRGEAPKAQSFLLLHAAWLASGRAEPTPLRGSNPAPHA
jgi:asparagine synthase (glutamine-hydrolysing)